MVFARSTKYTHWVYIQDGDGGVAAPSRSPEDTEGRIMPAPAALPSPAVPAKSPA